MKHLIFLMTILLSVSFISCNGHTAGAAANNLNAAIENASVLSGNAVFSYNLDGVKVSGGVVDAEQINNAVFITQLDKGKSLQFFLSDAYKETTETFAHSLRFTIPDKTGLVTLTPDTDSWRVALFKATGEDAKYSMYTNESFSITVTSISATRVAGTFSGKLKLLEGQGTGKEEVTITDGKFDIPIRAVNS